MSVTTFLGILTCVCMAGLIASLICHLIGPDLGELVVNIFFIVLLSLIAVGLVGFATDPSQKNTAEIQQSAADGAAIYTIQVIESDGTVSFKYRGDADVEVQPDRITFHDNDRTWTVFRDQSSTIIIANPE